MHFELTLCEWLEVCENKSPLTHESAFKCVDVDEASRL